MTDYFINTLHESRFKDMAIEDEMDFDDLERVALFYIISGNDILYKNRSLIYDWKKHSIRFCFDDALLRVSSGEESMIRLGFNLYNGWTDELTNPKDLLCNLDNTNIEIAEKAMRLRFMSHRIGEKTQKTY